MKKKQWVLQRDINAGATGYQACAELVWIIPICTSLTHAQIECLPDGRQSRFFADGTPYLRVIGKNRNGVCKIYDDRPELGHFLQIVDDYPTAEGTIPGAEETGQRFWASPMTPTLYTLLDTTLGTTLHLYGDTNS